jgi:hypothetical protein
MPDKPSTHSARELGERLAGYIEQVNAAGCPECGCRRINNIMRIESRHPIHVCCGCGTEWRDIEPGDIEALEARMTHMFDALDGAKDDALEAGNEAKQNPEIAAFWKAAEAFQQGFADAWQRITQSLQEAGSVQEMTAWLNAWDAGGIPPVKPPAPPAAAAAPEPDDRWLVELRAIRKAVEQSAADFSFFIAHRGRM